MKKDKSIVLNLMTEKGFEVLKSISHFKNLIAFIIIGKDASVNDDYSEKIKTLCIDNNIDFYYQENQPKIDKNIYVIAVSWRWMIKHPKNKLIVFHDSILPKYRGFAPLVNMLINGEKEIGVSAIFGSDEYDRGEIISQKKTEIVYPIKIQEAIQINNENFKSLVLEVIEKISSDNNITSIPQKESDSSYSIWRDYNDYYVDWSKSSIEVKRLIDAVGFPYLGARSKLSNGDEIIIKDAEVIPDIDTELRHIGKVIFVEQGCPIVICGSGLLKITDASFVETNLSSQFLPLKKFRTRFI
jgi:methionyl-tRNA formyltransferase